MASVTPLSLLPGSQEPALHKDVDQDGEKVCKSI
jgi:hypothetical protein